ncbi:MAG: helix-turn-helix domain-containing protein [Anaerolineae bacterium]|nr:helix-turn-helix domain-containing protein [Thermoflexales bacterium]MDW8408820.1 helix-turn-helix domain-containing protein [Anaerolineae bacterium]
MSIQSIYLLHQQEPDAAIKRGLTQAGSEIIYTHNFSETLDHLPVLHGGNLAAHEDYVPTILVAELQAGALALLSILHERMRAADSQAVLPPTLVFDREGKDIYAPIKALRLGVQEYLLASDPDIDREFSAQLLVERVVAEREQRFVSRQSASQPFVVRPSARPNDQTPIRQKIEWEPIGRVIRVEGKYIHLSPIEARIFSLLFQNMGHTVTLQDFMRYALNKPDMPIREAVQQLRPHMMRLRRKLAVQPDLASRIVNMRGTGYIFTV